MKTLLIRVDGIGDLISTLPADQNPSLTDDKVTWLIAEGLSFVTRAAGRTAQTVNAKGGWTAFWRLVQWLKAEKFDRCFLFHAPWWISLAVFWAGVPYRGGKKSQWHSFLFLNKSVRQSRKKSDRHEADYNYELISLSFSSDDTADKPPLLELPFTAPYQGLPENYLVVHPGMKGSALNWPQRHYKDLILQTSQTLPVVITGTAADKAWLSELEPLKDEPNVHWKIGELSGDELISVLASAKAVVAPSTGVAHLAASTQTPTLTLFSPIQSQAPARWAPRGSSVKNFKPEVVCPAASDCLGKECKDFFCMDLIGTNQVLEWLEKIIQSRGDKK